MSAPLSLRALGVWYGSQQAVHAVDLDVPRGRIVALIGETGCGKSSVALAAARLLPAGSRTEGQVFLAGEDVTRMNGQKLRRFRGASLGFVTQDALAALNPVMRAGRQIAEVYQLHQGLNRHDAERGAVEALRLVRIPDPVAVARLYPHQLSGGMRQRVMIAIALARRPPVVIADEPTTALDVSTQAAILRLVRDLCHELGTGILWITHDMGVVAEVADSVMVMYAGRVVEDGTTAEIFTEPRHPYTQALLRTLHDMRHGRPGSPVYQIDGQPPSLRAPVPGCAFHPRCAYATKVCTEVDPELLEVGAGSVACHHPLSERRVGI